MSTLRLPYFWRGMGFTQKAGYLCSSNQAKNYSDACSILRSMRRPKARKTEPVKPRLPYADN